MSFGRLVHSQREFVAYVGVRMCVCVLLNGRFVRFRGEWIQLGNFIVMRVYLRRHLRVEGVSEWTFRVLASFRPNQCGYIGVARMMLMRAT